ncbi:hypothetical protein POM88_022261 [Heracleum sosnowskyi]|uniref:GAG-pre-integrase domain-containing protein n=1 Tax=Heracleum sosnowskyi TaxID=360622 RepID=A0AAD8MTC4_9APIA|nr:hypothetical protein POM88_022261 [Heracleum sosnowskyi]
MADSSEESPQLSQVPILTTIDMSNSEYKKTVQDLSVELFNVHTSMLASEMENAKLVLKIKNLESKNEELELVAVILEDLKQKNAYLENKVKCNDEIETILRKQISELDLKLNAFKNSTLITKEIIDSQTIGNKTAIGFDYNKKAGKKIVEFPVTPSAVKRNTPHVLKNVDYPVFVKPFPPLFNEDDLFIRQELLEEDLLKEKEVKTKLPRNSVKTVIPKTEVGDLVIKAKKNRNGKKKIVNQEIVSFSPIASRKLCTICNSTGHLTHACKKVKVETANTSEMHNMSDMPDLHEPCGKKECLICTYNIMHAYFKLMNDSSKNTVNVKSTDTMNIKQGKTKLNFNPVKGKVKISKVMWILDSGCSRHMTGEESLLTEVIKKTGPIVTFGDDNKGFTTGYGYNVDFRKDKCLITNRKDEKLALLGVRKGNLFIADLSSTSEGEVTCFYSKASSEQSWLCHKKLSHLNFKTMNSLVKRELVRGLPLMEFNQEGLCEACEKGKSKKASHRSKGMTSIAEPLQLIHMDLFGPVNVMC